MMYDDIIYLNNPPNMKHKLSLKQRSAQFSAFDALEGYSDEIHESERITKERIYITESKKEMLNEKINKIIKNNISTLVEFVYFEKDKFKNGGEYKTIKGKINKIDLINKIIILNNVKIPINEVIDIKVCYNDYGE